MKGKKWVRGKKKEPPHVRATGIANYAEQIGGGGGKASIIAPDAPKRLVRQLVLLLSAAL